MVGQLFLLKTKFSQSGNVQFGKENKQIQPLAKNTRANFPDNFKFDSATTDTSMSGNEEDWGVVQAATAELERGLEAAGDGPPHFSGSGCDLASTDTEELVAGAMSSDSDDNASPHPDYGGVQRFPSSPPEDFQARSKGAHKLLGRAAYYCATGRQMLQEHRKVQGQADMYMTEVCASY